MSFKNLYDIQINNVNFDLDYNKKGFHYLINRFLNLIFIKLIIKFITLTINNWINFCEKLINSI